MNSRLVVRGLGAFGALALVAVLSVTAVAQQASARAVQGTDGNLYLVQGGSAWHLVPDQISDSDVGALTPSGEVDGTLGGQPTPLRSVQGSDGTLYLVQGSTSWTLVPDQISDQDLAALSPSGEVDGLIPNQFVVTPAPPPVAAQPPAPTPTPAPAPAPAAAPTSIAPKPIDISGQWQLTETDSTGAYPAVGTIVANGSGGVTMTTTAQVVWTFSGTLSGSTMSLDGTSSNGYKAHFQSLVNADGTRIEGTWTRSDGDQGTWVATRK